MGLLDDAKKKLGGLVEGKETQIKSGMDKAARTLEDKVGEKNAAKVEQVVDKAKEVVDKLAE